MLAGYTGSRRELPARDKYSIISTANLAHLLQFIPRNTPRKCHDVHQDSW